MFRLISVLLVLALALGPAFGTGSFSPKRAEHLFVKGLAYTTPAEPLADFVAKTVTDIARSSGDGRQVQVNRSFNHHNINVLLLDFRRIPSTLIPAPSSGLYSIRPNVLVIDVNMAQSLVLNAFNDSVSFTQMLMSLDARAKKDIKESDTLLDPASEGTLAFHLRLRNLRYQDEVGKLGDAIVLQNNDSRMQRILGLAFVFPIGHELFHLRTTARWLPRISYFIEREEAQADNHARKLIEQLVSRSSKPGSGEFLDPQLSVLSMRHFQDIVLSDLFHGFRGLDAEDYLAVLFHRSCKLAKRIPWPQRFHNPDVVFQAAERGFPILSEREFAQIGHRLRRFSNETHGGLLQRILQMRTAFKKNENWVQAVDSGFQYAEILNSAYFSPVGPSALTQKDDGAAIAGNLSLKGLLNQLVAQRDWQRGAGCSHGECGLLLWSDGYMEANLRNGIVLNLRIVEPFNGDELPRTRSTVAYFFGNQEADRLQREIRGLDATCKVGTFAHENSSYIVLSHVLNETGIIETEIQIKTLKTN
ncbi:hypothetical protein CLU94_1152 [Janthinobacterium sp. 13]|nr:hypothetical protein CLU94_1152 [Janthinobacterium sp. 13]